MAFGMTSFSLTKPLDFLEWQQGNKDEIKEWP